MSLASRSISRQVKWPILATETRFAVYHFLQTFCKCQMSFWHKYNWKYLSPTRVDYLTLI